MKQSEIIELLKSGNFSIHYHDNDCPALYKGHIKYEDTPDEKEIEIPDNELGYCPSIVTLLVKALGGKCDSI